MARPAGGAEAVAMSWFSWLPQTPAAANRGQYATSSFPCVAALQQVSICFKPMRTV